MSISTEIDRVIKGFYCMLKKNNHALVVFSRMFFVGARNGHLPDIIALININRFTPLPAVLSQVMIRWSV